MIHRVEMIGFDPVRRENVYRSMCGLELRAQEGGDRIGPVGSTPSRDADGSRLSILWEKCTCSGCLEHIPGWFLLEEIHDS